MGHARGNAACAVFGGKVVVSGGVDRHDGDGMNTAEAYDQDAWSHFPNMNRGRHSHCLVAAGAKLYAIGGYMTNTCEVYDGTEFVALKQMPGFVDFNKTLVKAVFIGRKIVVFGDFSSNVASYHVDEDRWSVEPCEVTKHIGEFICLKVPLEM